MNETELTEKIKTVQLEIAQVLADICERNGIRYFLAYGTLLGAIRHDGFIPWDDDIDIMMPYPDLLKFEEACKRELPQGYFYQSPNTDPEYDLTIMRLCKDNTVMLEERMKDKNIHHGIFVDIYPLFGAATGFGRKIQVFRAMKRALYLWGKPPENHGALTRMGSKFLLALKPKRKRKKAADKLFKKIALDYDACENVTVLDSRTEGMRRDYARAWFGEGVPHVFEDTAFKIPADAHSVLEKRYGDYMALPPENERVPHHDYVRISFDAQGSDAWAKVE